MKRKAIAWMIILWLVISLGGTAFLLNAPSGDKSMQEFTVQVNRLILYVEKQWETLENGGAERKKVMTKDMLPSFDFTVTDSDGDVLFQTRDGLSKDVSQATLRFDLIRDVEVDGAIVGKLIVHNDSADAIKRRNRSFAILYVALSTVVLLCILGYDRYLRKKVIKPFHDMEDCARQIAMGNLDVPLTMDRENVFGAFTQSFDLMREELKASRLREEAALHSRKEMIAQLSHDIKTPVASIKAMADVMELSAANEDQRQTISAINAKADQIDKLISNLFHATLEELEHLEVNCEELSSVRIAQMIREADPGKHVVGLEIREADPGKRTAGFEIPECVVLADPLRLSQVIGNIISNSYKYANTVITVKGSFERQGEKDYLTLEFGDQGGGVPEEELYLITEKFKRGTNSAGKDGAGLGLYISDYLMKKMGGSLNCRNQGGGLAVIIRLPLA